MEALVGVVPAFAQRRSPTEPHWEPEADDTLVEPLRIRGEEQPAVLVDLEVEVDG